MHHVGKAGKALADSREFILPERPADFLQRFAHLPVLSVKRKQWRMEQSEKESNDADPVFRQVRKRVLERDGHRCLFCGFSSPSHQEIHHLDGDHANHALDNLVTVCSIDYLCLHLGMGALKGAIFLAVVPELTQAEITNLMRLYHCALAEGDEEVRDRLAGLYAIFESRSVDVFKRVFEADFSNGQEIAIAISRLDDAAFSSRSRTLEGIRVIPTESVFHSGQIAGYLAASRGTSIDRNEWPALLDALRR